MASSDNTIGGTSDAARNVISGNSYAGIYIDGVNNPDIGFNTIEGNYIGPTMRQHGAAGKQVWHHR